MLTIPRSSYARSDTFDDFLHLPLPTTVAISLGWLPIANVKIRLTAHQREVLAYGHFRRPRDEFSLFGMHGHTEHPRGVVVGVRPPISDVVRHCVDHSESRKLRPFGTSPRLHAVRVPKLDGTDSYRSNPSFATLTQWRHSPKNAQPLRIPSKPPQNIDSR